MGALTIGFMGSGERLKLGTPYQWTSNSVSVLATNEGGSTVKITAARVQGYGVDQFIDIPDVVIEPKETKPVNVTLTSGTFVTGYEYTIVLVTANNNEFRTSGTKP
jgi:hypothetical protein